MEKKMKNPWDFKCPPYDQRSSSAVNAGWHHGVGKAQPVGSETHSSKGPIKFGREHTMRDDVKG